MELPLNINNSEQLEKLRKLFKVKKTEGEMMKLRGYDLNVVNLLTIEPKISFMPIDMNWLQEPYLQFSDILKIREDNNIFKNRQEFSSVYMNKATEDKILVLYLGNEPGKQVGTDDFKLFLLFLSLKQYHHIIIITETGLNPDKKNYIKTQIGNNYNIEIFFDHELAFNKLKHAYNPLEIVYIPNTDGKPGKYAAKEGLQLNKLPMMLEDDIKAKMYNSKPQGLFMLIQMGLNTETSVMYRLVRQTPTVAKK